MADIVGYPISGLVQDTNGYQVINGNYSIPYNGYLLIQKQRQGTITVGGVSMSELSHLGDAVSGTWLFGLKVTAGTKTIVCSVSTYSIHAILFSFSKGYRQIVTATVKTPISVTPQRGDALGQFVYCTKSSANTSTTFYVPPTGFTELSDSGAIGSGSDWWHGGGTSYQNNVGTSAVSMAYTAFTADQYYLSYNVELDKEVSAGGSQTIWWFKKWWKEQQEKKPKILLPQGVTM